MTNQNPDDAQAARWARREPLIVLFSRMQRGVLSAAERPLLRAAAEAELADGDQAHTALAEARATAEQHRRDLADALGEARGHNWPHLIGRAGTIRAAATERADLLEEARDELERAGQTGAHGDDWPAIAPAIRALAEERDQARERAAALTEAESADVTAGSCPGCAEELEQPGKSLGMQGPTCGEPGWAEQERARMERLYTAAYSRADQAERQLIAARAEADGWAEIVRNEDRLTSDQLAEVRADLAAAEATITRVRDALNALGPLARFHMAMALGDRPMADAALRDALRITGQDPAVTLGSDPQPTDHVPMWCPGCSECTAPAEQPACTAQFIGRDPHLAASCDLRAGHDDSHRDSSIPGILRWTDDAPDAVGPAEVGEQPVPDLTTPVTPREIRNVYLRDQHPVFDLIDALTSGSALADDAARDLIGRYYNAITSAPPAATAARPIEVTLHATLTPAQITAAVRQADRTPGRGGW